MTPTHQVIDMVYHEDEGNIAFEGSYTECMDWLSEQPDYYTYKVQTIIQPQHSQHDTNSKTVFSK